MLFYILKDKKVVRTAKQEEKETAKRSERVRVRHYRLCRFYKRYCARNSSRTRSSAPPQPSGLSKPISLLRFIMLPPPPKPKKEKTEKERKGKSRRKSKKAENLGEKYGIPFEKKSKIRYDVIFIVSIMLLWTGESISGAVAFFLCLFFFLFRKRLKILSNLLYWIIKDKKKAFAERKANRDKVRLYGLTCYVGLPGYGKTMSLVKYLDDTRRQYGDKVYIATNFAYKGEDFPLTEQAQLLKIYDKSIVFGIDEAQNDFNSRRWDLFPDELIAELTQNRKGNGKQIVYTTQIFSNVDKNFRGLTKMVVECKTRFNRLTVCRHYQREVYEARYSATSISVKRKMKHLRKESFIQTDFHRSRYDSFKRLDLLKVLPKVETVENRKRKF